MPKDHFYIILNNAKIYGWTLQEFAEKYNILMYYNRKYYFSPDYRRFYA